MKVLSSKKPATAAKNIINFLIPKNVVRNHEFTNPESIKAAAIIPTYRPTQTTYKLIESLTKWYPELQIVVVDDCTPLVFDEEKIIDKIKQHAKEVKTLTYLRTPVNTLKAGALNYGIDYLTNQKNVPEVIFTSDDDVQVDKNTLYNMIDALVSDTTMGAVCSQALVKNKNVNLLTRLQSLEYHSFNITRTADNGFLKGPLVMHGMLSAFKTKALQQVKGFTKYHLIEDYEITIRLKNAGWNVKFAHNAKAWTEVPESVDALWKQRVRWSYGGLGVVRQYWRNTTSIFQDLVGHSVFILLALLISISLLTHHNAAVNSTIIAAVVGIAVVNFIVAFVFNTATMMSYHGKDKLDWVLKLAILPELIYCNILTLILLGSYLFFAYSVGFSFLVKKVKMLLKPYNFGLNMFSKVGYSASWGTRQD